MKRIKAMHSDNDRIICVSMPKKQVFYYQVYGTNSRQYLFETKFSGSVFGYFRSRGRSLGRGYSLTIKELYKFRDYRIWELSHVIERIPVILDYILNETAA